MFNPMILQSQYKQSKGKHSLTNLLSFCQDQMAFGQQWKVALLKTGSCSPGKSIRNHRNGIGEWTSFCRSTGRWLAIGWQKQYHKQARTNFNMLTLQV